MDGVQEKEVSNGLRLLAKTSVWVFVAVFLSKIFTYFYRILIARNFGPEIYGVFSLATMILGWFALFASFGLSDGLIRYVAWYREKKEQQKINFLLKSTLFIYSISGIILGFLLFFLSRYIALNFFHNSELIIFLKLFAFLIPITIFANIFLSILQGFEKIKEYSFIVNILQNFIKIFALYILIFLGFNAHSIIFSYFLGVFSMFIFSYLICKYSIQNIFLKVTLAKQDKQDLLQNFVSYSWPLFFVMAITEIFYWTDSFLIGYFNGAISVGFYNAAVPIVLFLAVIPELFSKLFFPMITKEFANKKIEVVRQISQQVGKWIFILVLPMFIILFLFPGVIINLLFGGEYLVAVDALRILSIGGLITSLFMPHYNLLSMAGKSKKIFYIFLFISISNIILNLFLIPPFGISGAAAATTISKIFMAILLSLEVKRELNVIPFRKKIIQIFFISLIPTILILLIRKVFEVNLFILFASGILFFITYFALIFLTKSFDKNDMEIIKIIKNKIFTR